MSLKCDYCGFPVYSKPVLLRGKIFCRQECADDYFTERENASDLRKGMKNLFKTSKSSNCDNFTTSSAG
jgi:hypothetical protein